MSRKGIMDKLSKKKRFDCVLTVVECVIMLVKSWVSLEAYSNGENVSLRLFDVLGDRGYKSGRIV